MKKNAAAAMAKLPKTKPMTTPAMTLGLLAVAFDCDEIGSDTPGGGGLVAPVISDVVLGDGSEL